MQMLHFFCLCKGLDFVKTSCIKESALPFLPNLVVIHRHYPPQNALTKVRIKLSFIP